MRAIRMFDNEYYIQHITYPIIYQSEDLFEEPKEFRNF